MASLWLMALLYHLPFDKTRQNKIPNFSLMGTSGQVYTQADFENKKTLALVFMSNHCKGFSTVSKSPKQFIKKFEKEATYFSNFTKL